MGNEKRNIWTAVIGVAFILVGTGLLAAQINSALDYHPIRTPDAKHRQIGCGEDVVPFDSYQKYMPHVVRHGLPLGAELAALRLEIEATVRTAIAKVEAHMAEARAARRTARSTERALDADRRSEEPPTRGSASSI